jgi:YfiH family protein
VHGTVVRRVEPGKTPLKQGPAWDAPPGESLIEADGHATALPGLGVMVLTADCLPVALGSVGAVAMLHAGWRGLAAGVLEEGVRAMRDLGGGEEIVAVIGPGAGVCCYEVGAEVHAALGGGGSAAGHIDLHAIARERLVAAGVDRVRDPGICTICDLAFFSHRREGARAGRQAGVAWLS